MSQSIQYQVIKDTNRHDLEEEETYSAAKSSRQPSRTRRGLTALAGLLALLVILASALQWQRHALISEASTVSQYAEASSSQCSEPELRQEWRTLTADQKSHYIQAVQCLAELPSRLIDNANATAYDDFPWVHALKSERGEMDHRMPMFLPFHRYLLHIYEQKLRDKCGYRGNLPYWDWTLDWTDMPNSPVFDPLTGFGGDGEANGAVVLDHGRCVVDGPFAHLRPLYRQTTYHPHCLTRGFRKGAKSGKTFPGNDIRPEKIDDILKQDSFDGFSQGLEMGPHNIIPYSIRGDFFSFSSPYEPLFFLHHAQLDRLWWIWQHRGRNRVFAYGVNGTLDDTLDMHGLAPNVLMGEVMSSQSSMMCYRYF